MNERVKQWLEEATEIHDDHITGHSERVVDYKTFAELLIRDAMIQCDKAARSYESTALSEYVTDGGRLLYEGMWGGAKNCSILIAEHFGLTPHE